MNKENCINCKIDYSQELKYCPNCGIKNPHFIESDKIINEFKMDIENNTYFKSKVENEMKKINKKTVNKSFFSSAGFGGSKDSSGKSSQSIDKTGYSIKPKKSNDVICPKCGVKNEKSCNFCTNCGFNLQNMVICPKCGVKNENSCNFCTNCGTSLN